MAHQDDAAQQDIATSVPGTHTRPGTVIPAQASPTDTAVPTPGGPVEGELVEGGPVEGELVQGELVEGDAFAGAVARLSEPDLAPAQRRRAIGDLVAAMRLRGFRDALRPKALLAWMTETVVDVAPRIPLRDLETLRRHFPQLSDLEIADRLVRNAARATAGVGALGGGVASLEWAAPPALLTAPVLLAAETVAVISIEIKLIGELQELYGQSVAGGAAQRALSLVRAWAARRGVNPLAAADGAMAVVGTAARFELRGRLLRRFGRNLTTLGPLLTGAAAAAFLNRRATLRLADEVRTDLAKHRP